MLLSRSCIVYGVLVSTVLFNDEVVEARISRRKTARDPADEESNRTPLRKTMKKTKKPKKAKKAKKKKYDTYYDDDDASAPGLGGASGEEEPPKEKKKQSIGLALPGGAFAAGAAVGGIMRGFQRSTILIDGEERPAMEGFDYVASLSGGNFANVLYSYAPGTTSDEILDADGIGHPSEITAEELDNIPETSMFSLFPESINVTLAYSIINTILFKEDLWDTFVHTRFLAPFGISRFQAIGKTRDDVKAVPLVMTSLAGPSELYPDYVTNLDEGMNNKFIHLVRASTDKYLEIPSLPTLRQIPNDVLWELAKSTSYQMPYGAYISPDEFTIPMLEHRASFNDFTNLTADPIDFIPVATHPDDLEPKRDPLFGFIPRTKRPFTLAKLLSAGTNVLSILLSQSSSLLSEEYLEVLEPLLGVPSTIEIPTADGSKREMAVVDGGYNSATGIASLVHKGVRKIVCHIYSVEASIIRIEQVPPFVFQASEVTKFFGVHPKGPYSPPPDDKLTLDFVSKAFFATGNTNHLFDLNSNGENQLVKLFDMWGKLHEAGEPLIATLKDLDVVENKFWGIKGGGKVDLTVIMNIGVPKKFSDEVPLDAMNIPDGVNATDSFGFFTDPDLTDVPNLRHITDFAEFNIPMLNVSLDTPIPDYATRSKATRMTEILNSWMIEHSWEGLKDKDGNVVFEGFKEIFEEDNE